MADVHETHLGYRDIDKRLATIEGHIRAIRGMMAKGKCCVELITQLMAIEKSIKSASVALLKNHLNTCVKDSADDPDKIMTNIEEFGKILQMYL